MPLPFLLGGFWVTLGFDCGGTIGGAILGKAATHGAEVGGRDGVGTGAGTGGSGWAGGLFFSDLDCLGRALMFRFNMGIHTFITAMYFRRGWCTLSCLGCPGGNTVHWVI